MLTWRIPLGTLLREAPTGKQRRLAADAMLKWEAAAREKLCALNDRTEISKTTPVAPDNFRRDTVSSFQCG